MSKIFDVAACQFELEDGITKEQAIDLINQLPEGRIIPFFTSANNTSAAGFIAFDVFEKFGVQEIDEMIIKFIESIIEDQDKETDDGFYDFNGVSISLQYKPTGFAKGETTNEMCSSCMIEQEMPANSPSMCTCGDVMFPCSTCDDRVGNVYNDQVGTKDCEWEKDKGCWRFSYYSTYPSTSPVVMMKDRVEANNPDIPQGRRTGCVGDFAREYQTKRKCYAEFLCSIANRLQVEVTSIDLWEYAVAIYEFTSDEFFNEGTGGEFEWYVPTEAELEVMKSCFG